MACTCKGCYIKSSRPLPQMKVAAAPSGDAAFIGKELSLENHEPPMEYAQQEHKASCC